MSPCLRVLAGTSSSSMTPITPLVNTSRTHYVSSPLFEGRIVVHIKGMTDEKGRVRESEYVERGDASNGRAGVTWSIQVQGRFLVPYSADDILFGNTFDRPLKLPWGTSAVLKFMHYIDPTLEHDLTSSSKPWALSPLIATMPHFMHTRLSLSPADVRSGKAKAKMPTFPTREPIGDDTRELYLALADSRNGGVEGEAEVEREVGEDGEDVLEGVHSQERSRDSHRGQTQAPLMVATSPPMLIPGPVPPIPAMSKYSSSQSLARNGSVATMTSTSTRRSSLSVASSSSSASVSLEPLPSAKTKRGQGSSRLSVSSSLSSSSSSSASSASSSGSGASVASGTGNGTGSSVVSISTNNTNNSGGSKSTRSSGLSSIRMKTKDVVRKVKGKKSVSGGGGDAAAICEARRRKEEELKSLENAAQRRAYFASRERRKDVVFGPEDVITTDFCYGFISFAPSLALQLPGGLSFDLMKYWDGQPVRFVCCERPGISASGRCGSETGQSKEKLERGTEPWGRIFWCVAIEIVDEGDEGEGDDDEGEEEE